jgi:hypothetical protein
LKEELVSFVELDHWEDQHGARTIKSKSIFWMVVIDIDVEG